MLHALAGASSPTPLTAGIICCTSGRVNEPVVLVTVKFLSRPVALPVAGVSYQQQLRPVVGGAQAVGRHCVQVAGSRAHGSR